MKYDIVLLDADNTLFDYKKAETAALEASFRFFNLDFCPENADEYRRINQSLWERHNRGEIGVDELKIERFRRLFEALGVRRDPVEVGSYYLERLGDNAQLLDGALELCSALSKQCRLAIVTNGVSRTQRRRLDASPIQKYFEKIFISGEMGCQKPQKEYFDLVLEEMKASDKSRVLVVGDSLSLDIQGANNAGLASCWYNPEELPLTGTARPDYIISRLSDLLDIVE